MPNAVTRIREFGLTQRYDIELFVSRKAYFSVSQYLNLDRFFFKAYRFNDQIDLEPFDYQYALNPAREGNFESSVRFFWFFAPNSQLRISYQRSRINQTNMTQNGILFISGFPADELFGNSFNNFDMTVIWNLNRK